jgi:hypothetical protein
MLHMLCRNRVADFARWKTVFDSHANAHRTAGLCLLHLWREQGDPDNVFFLFEVEDREKALAFVSDPAAAAAAEESGVIDGELRILLADGED